MYHKLFIPVVGIAALAVAHDIRTHRKAKQDVNDLVQCFLHSQEAFAETIKEYTDQQKTHLGQLSYLMDKLNENEIPFEEFDLIALNYFNK